MLFLFLPYLAASLTTHSLGAKLFGFGTEHGDQVRSVVFDAVYQNGDASDSSAVSRK